MDLIQNLIHKALKQAKTFNYVSHNSIKKKLSSPWWTKELQLSRKVAHRCFTRFKRTRALTDLASYKKANNKYLKLIKRNKAKSWHKHCTETSSSSARTSKLLKILTHKKTVLTSVQKPDGSYTESISETLQKTTYLQLL